jgi:hypothetical protein
VSNVRREFSAKTKRLAWERCNEQCEYIRPDGTRCRAPLATGRFIYDHCDPDWYSKDNELENCSVICLPCNREKTAKDQGDIAKSKRIIDKRIKARKPKGRPLMGTKASGFKKKFNGTVERR